MFGHNKNYNEQDTVLGQEKLLTGKLNCEQKKHFWNVALYAAETWH